MGKGTEISRAVDMMIEQGLATRDGDLLPARPAIEGRILDDGSRGKYGWAMIEGVRFGVIKISMEFGAVIFTCALMLPATFPFTIRPGSPAKIYGNDDQLVVDYLVPGLGSDVRQCEVRPGDKAMIYLPIRIGEVATPVGEGHRVPNDAFIEPLKWRQAED